MALAIDPAELELFVVEVLNCCF